MKNDNITVGKFLRNDKSVQWKQDWYDDKNLAVKCRWIHEGKKYIARCEDSVFAIIVRKFEDGTTTEPLVFKRNEPILNVYQRLG